MTVDRIRKALAVCPVPFMILVGLNAFQNHSNHSAFFKGPYLQNVKTGAITIMWESKEPAIGKVVFGKTPSFGSEVVETDSATVHEVTLTGLEAETVYHYQVISGGVKSPAHTFKTAVRKESPFSFVVYGDNKNGPFNHAKVANLILARNPNFVIHNGDLVDNGNVYKQWEKLFFTPTKNLMSGVPLFTALGNHEEHAKLYFDFFSLPNNEQWYSYDFGNAHFIVLDSDKKQLAEGSEQLNWLIQDLEKNKAAWTFVNFHHVIFTAGGNHYRQDRIFRKNLLHPIFAKYGVDMVLSGHDHNYERTYPIAAKNGGESNGRSSPITYIVCGNGGTPMRYAGKRQWTHYAERVFGFVLIKINGAKLHFQSINIDGKVIDEFFLDKSDPNSVAAYEAKKIYFEDIHEPVEAIRHYEAGDDSLDDKSHASALAAFEKAFRADTTCTEALAGMAECHRKLGDLDRAIQYALQGVRQMPNYPDSYEVLIDVYMAQKKYDQALEWCQKWLRLEPDETGPNRRRSKIFLEQQRRDLAIQELQKALAVNPAEARIYFDLAKLYEAAGDQKNALSHYQKGLEWFMDEEENPAVGEARAKVENQIK